MGNYNNKQLNEYVNLSKLQPQSWDSAPSIIAMSKCGKVVVVNKPAHELTTGDREKLDSIIMNGDGTLFLSDDGTYKYMDLDNIPHIVLAYEKDPSNFIINNLDKLNEIRQLIDSEMETFVRMDFGNQILPVSIRYNEKQLILEFDHILLSQPRQKDRPFSKLKLLIILDTTKKIPKVIHYEVKTGVDADNVLFIDGDGSEALFNDGTYKPAYTKEQVDNLINTYLSDYYTKEQLDEIIRLNNGNYYTSEEVDRVIRENNENYYTKEEIDTTLDGYYTQEESDKNLSDAVNNAVFYDANDNIHPRKDIYLDNGRTLYGIASNKAVHRIAELSDKDTIHIGATDIQLDIHSGNRPTIQVNTQTEPEAMAYLSDVESAASLWQENLDKAASALQGKIEQANNDLTDHINEYVEYKDQVNNRFESAEASINGLDKRVTANEVATGENKEDILHIREDLASRELFRGYYLTTHEITALENPHKGNYAWNAETGTVWCYNGTTWSDSGEEIPDQTVHAYNDTPQRDGEAFAGDSNEYARGDHRHPTDISRAAVTDLDNYLPLAGNSYDTPVTGNIWLESGKAFNLSESGNSSLQQDINSQTTILRGDGMGGIDLTSENGTIKANGQRIIVQGENESNVRVHAPYVQLGSSDSTVSISPDTVRITGETMTVDAAKDIHMETAEGNIVLDPAGTLYYGNPSFASNQVATVGDIEAAGYLPLSGGTITGNLNINGEANLNGSPVATAATLDSYYTKDAVDTIQSGLQSQIDQTGVEFNKHLGEYEEYRELVSSSFENVNEEITSLDRRTGQNEAAIEANSQDIDTLREDLASRELFRGYYLTTNEITGIDDPKPGDYAWNARTGTVWYYNGTTWADTENIIPDQTVVAYDGTPQRDGEATPGASNEYARGDHRHPVDITRAAVTDLDNYLPLTGGTLSGDLTLPGTNAINLQDYSGAELQLKGDGLTKATGSIRVTASGDTAEVTISGKKAVNIETGTFQYNGEEVATEAGLSDLANQAADTYVAKAGDTITGDLSVTGGNITLDADQSLRFSGNGAVRAEYNTAEGRLNIITTTTDNGINVATNPSAESSRFTYNGVEVATLDDVLEKTDILDNLASDRTDAALSANQGRVLDDKIKTEIEDRSAADAVLGVQIIRETQRAREAEERLEQLIEDTDARALEAEAELRQSLEDETNRAKAEEKRISDAVEELDESLKNYVDLTSDQTIAGIKTFTSHIRTATGSGVYINKKSLDDENTGVIINPGIVSICGNEPNIEFYANNSNTASSHLFGSDGYLYIPAGQRLNIGSSTDPDALLSEAVLNVNGLIRTPSSIQVLQNVRTGNKTSFTDGIAGAILTNDGRLYLQRQGEGYQPTIYFIPNGYTSYQSRILGYAGYISVQNRLSINSYIDPKTLQSGAVLYANGNIIAASSISTHGKTGHADGTSGIYLGAGQLEITGPTPYIDFHYENSTDDYTSRIIEIMEGLLAISGKLKIGTVAKAESGYTLWVSGSTRINEILYVDTSIYTGGKTQSIDGKAGCALTLGNLHMTSATDPLIRLYRENSTTSTWGITHSEDGFAYTTGRLGINTDRDDPTLALRVGGHMYVLSTIRSGGVITSGGAVYTHGRGDVASGKTSGVVLATGYIDIARTDGGAYLRFKSNGSDTVTGQITNEADNYIYSTNRWSIGANTNNSNYTLYVTGNAYVSTTLVAGGLIRAQSHINTNGKSSLDDGIAGVRLTDSGITTCAAGNPYIRFYRENATGEYTQITNAALGVLNINGNKILTEADIDDIIGSIDLSSYLPKSAGTSNTLTGTLYTQIVVPEADNTYTLGTTTRRWSYLRVAGSAFMGSSILVGGKETYTDGVAGGILGGNGRLYLTSRTGEDPSSISFYNNNSTSITAQITHPLDNVIAFPSGTRVHIGAETDPNISDSVVFNVTGNSKFYGAIYANIRRLDYTSVIGGEATPFASAWINTINGVGLTASGEGSRFLTDDGTYKEPEPEIVIIDIPGLRNYLVKDDTQIPLSLETRDIIKKAVHNRKVIKFIDSHKEYEGDVNRIQIIPTLLDTYYWDADDSTYENLHSATFSFSYETRECRLSANGLCENGQSESYIVIWSSNKQEVYISGSNSIVLNTHGEGNKFLTDDGTYKEPEPEIVVIDIPGLRDLSFDGGDLPITSEFKNKIREAVHNRKTIKFIDSDTYGSYSPNKFQVLPIVKGVDYIPEEGIEANADRIDSIIFEYMYELKVVTVRLSYMFYEEGSMTVSYYHIPNLYSDGGVYSNTQQDGTKFLANEGKYKPVFIFENPVEVYLYDLNISKGYDLRFKYSDSSNYPFTLSEEGVSDGAECILSLYNATTSTRTQALPTGTNIQCSETSIDIEPEEIVQLSIRYLFGKFLIKKI